MVTNESRLRDGYTMDLTMAHRLTRAQADADHRGLRGGVARDLAIYRAAERDVKYERAIDISWLLFMAFACGAGFSYLLAAFFGWPI